MKQKMMRRMPIFLVRLLTANRQAVQQQKAIHISTFRLATRLEAFVTSSLVIGRCRDVTVWVFYQTQSFDAKKS